MNNRDSKPLLGCPVNIKPDNTASSVAAVDDYSYCMAIGQIIDDNRLIWRIRLLQVSETFSEDESDHTQ